MLRFIVRQSDIAPVIHAQEPATFSFRTFDNDILGLENYLRFVDYIYKPPSAKDCLTRQLVGVELL